MPLLRPDIDKVLKSAGIGDESPISKKMDENNLSLNSTISRLADLTENASSDSVRLNAINTALKMHGALKESGPAGTQVTIVINDPKSQNNVDPILFPRPIPITEGRRPAAV